MDTPINTPITVKKVAQTARRRVQSTIAPVAPAVREAGHQVVDAIAGTLGMHGERMSKVDTAWLRMDNESNLMMIVGVWVLKPGLSYQDLAQRLEERLLKYPRFKQCAVVDAAGASWLNDPNFDIANHLVIEKLPKTKSGKSAGREQDALQQRLGELTMQPLDKSHPLWQMHLVEHYKGGSALLFRFHHCIADGIALVSVVQTLVDGGLPPPERANRAPHPHRHGLAGAEDWIADSVLKPLTNLTVKVLEAAGEGAARSVDLLMHPKVGLEHGLHGTAHLAKIALHAVSDATQLALLPNDSPTRLKGSLGQVKRVAWCAPLPFADVKAVSKALNCSINDVMLSCVAGAIGQYIKSKGDVAFGKEIRAMVPVNLRPIEKAYKLGNQFGLAPLLLPIGLENPVERVYEVRRRMQALKGSTQPILAFAVLGVAGLMAKSVQDAILGLFTSKTTSVMTNVPGPRDKLSICGSRVEESLFWVPQSGSVGLGVSILSYGGGVQFGVVSDANLCPDPENIVNRFEPEFGKISMVAMMLPRDDGR